MHYISDISLLEMQFYNKQKQESYRLTGEYSCIKQ